MKEKSSSFENYISSLPPRLTAEEQRQLFIRLKETGDKTIREKLIRHNLRLAASIVLKHYQNTPIGTDDLMQYATIGLVKAVDYYDVENGYLFSSYANVSIKNEILRALEPLSRTVQTVSIDNIPNEPEEHNAKTSFQDLIPDEDESYIEKDYASSELLKKIYSYVKENCTEREILIFEATLGINYPRPQTLEEIGTTLNLTHQRVDQIKKRLGEKLHKKFEKDLPGLKPLRPKKRKPQKQKTLEPTSQDQQQA